LDEVCVKINGQRHSLWRAVDHEGGRARKAARWTRWTYRVKVLETTGSGRQARPGEEGPLGQTETIPSLIARWTSSALLCRPFASMI
jgi:hypothetical protein